MKCLIASDIHGSAYWAKYLAKAIEQQQPDKIVLLGDLLYHGPRLFKIKFNHSIIVFNDYRIGGYTIGDINLCIRFMYQVTYS